MRSASQAAPRPSRTSLGEALSRRTIPGLDGLRAMSVLVVVAYHFGFEAVPGDLGVSAFFVLSGFLITWLLLQEYRRTEGISLRRFYLRRTMRIFPAYYLFGMFSIAVDTVRGHSWSSGLIASSVLYVMNYYNAIQGHPSTPVAHAWSLAIEEQFYLLWPILFLTFIRKGIGVLSRRRRECHRRGRRVAIAAVSEDGSRQRLRVQRVRYEVRQHPRRLPHRGVHRAGMAPASGRRGRPLGGAAARDARAPRVLAHLRALNLPLHAWLHRGCAAARALHDPDPAALQPSALVVARTSSDSVRGDDLLSVVPVSPGWAGVGAPPGYRSGRRAVCRRPRRGHRPRVSLVLWRRTSVPGAQAAIRGAARPRCAPSE